MVNGSRSASSWLRLAPLLLALAVVAAARADEQGSATAPTARCAWTQWGGSPAHDGHVCVRAQPAQRELAHLVIDRFAPLEEADSEGELLTHYQVPLLDTAGGV